MKECYILLILTVLAIAVDHGEGTTTYICVAIDDTPITSTCNHTYDNISLAFELHHVTSDTTFLIQPGNYTLLPVNITFDSLNNTNIMGNSSKDKEVIINCLPFAGLYFYNSNGIKINNVSFIGCGATYNRQLGKSNNSDALNISLYFVQCSNVNIESVTIANTRGSAVYMHATLGTNMIKGCTFQDNIPSPQHKGGCFVITFPKCPPLSLTTIENCNNGMYYHPNQVSYANYTIYNCTFRNNKANFKKRISHPSDLNHGRGGGLIIYFAWIAQYNTILVDKCLFEHNKALYGGGAFIAIADDSKYNTITFQRSNFMNNAASQGGGGVRIQFLIYNTNESSPAHDNKVEFHSCNFTGNDASLGGGVSLYTANEQNFNITNKFSFYDSIWNANTAKTGSAVDATAWLFFGGLLPRPFFSNCTFYKNTQGNLSPFYGVSDSSSVGTMYLDSVSVILDNVNFTENQATAIYSINNHLVFQKDSCSIFDRNNGTHGGAIALISNAAIVAEANVTVYYTNNTASVHGGAIYAFITSQHEDILSLNCFVHYYKPLYHPASWQALFYFRDNTVNGKKESIFATTLQYCTWEEDKSFIFCASEHQWDFGPDTNCTNEVRSMPKRITMSSPFLSVVLGKITTIQLSANDDNNNTVDSYVLFATNTSELEIDKDYRYISDKHIKMNLKNYSSLDNVSETIMLQTLFPRVLELNVLVHPLPCPPGYWINENSGECECSETSFGGNVIHCESNFTAMIRKGYWIGMYEKDKPVVGKCRFCAANLNQRHGGFIPLPKSYDDINDVLCGGQKGDVLCTRCLNNGSFALTVISYKCIDCSSKKSSYTWLYFMLTQFLPVIILVSILFFTNFPLVSGYLNGAIFFSQSITVALDISGDGEIPLSNVTRSENTVEVLLEIYNVLYDVWNLNFIEPIKFCLLPHMSMNMIFVWQYIVALSPMLIVLIIYIYYRLDERTTLTVKLWRYLCFLQICRRIESKWKHKVENRAQINYKERFRNIIASCILLSYTRCALNTCYILNGTPLYNSNNTHLATVPIFDGSTKFGHGHHIIYMSIAIGIAVFFLIPVPFILFCKRHNPDRDMVNKTFLNVLLRSFQCDYKDGHIQREGYIELAPPTPCNKIKHYCQSMWHCCFSDLRWVAGLYFVLRLAMALTFVLANTFFFQILMEQLLAIIMVIVFLILQPYRNELHNKIDGCIFLLIILINSITLYQYSLTVAMEKLSITAFVFQYVLVYVPMIWIGGYVFYKIINFCQAIRSREVDRQENENFPQPTDDIQEEASNTRMYGTTD